MKFGVFYNPMVPKAPGATDWDEDQERLKYSEMFEQIELADRLGFDYCFLGEHHFSAEYAHNSATEVLMGAVAARTSNIRIGTGIVHSSHNHPVRIAERIATIDVISDGRVEFGYGGGGGAEVAPFLGERIGERQPRAADAGQIAADILAARGLYPGTQSEFFTIPPVNVVPKVLQQPHPPLWTSTVMPGTAPEVARRGLGQLMLAVAGPELVKMEVDSYWQTLKTEAVTPVGKGINPAVFTFTNGLVAPTRELALERAYEGLQFFGWGLSGGAQMMVGKDGNMWDEFQAWKRGERDIRLESGNPDFVLEVGAKFADGPGNVFDSPEGTIELVRRFEETNVDGLLFNQMFGNTKHEHIMESLELIGTKVLPEFRERHHLHDSWRKEQLQDIDYPVVTSL